MAYEKNKINTLKQLSNSFKAQVSAFDAEITEFEKDLAENLSNISYSHVIDQSAADEAGLISYKEIAWRFFRGPLPFGYEAGFHLVFQSFKSTQEDYGDEEKYTNFFAEKLLLTSVENKQLAVEFFDDFIDGLNAILTNKLAE